MYVQVAWMEVSWEFDGLVYFLLNVDVVRSSPLWFIHVLAWFLQSVNQFDIIVSQVFIFIFGVACMVLLNDSLDLQYDYVNVH